MCAKPSRSAEAFASAHADEVALLKHAAHVELVLCRAPPLHSSRAPHRLKCHGAAVTGCS